MSEESYQLYRLLKEDDRYSIEAYQFVREALAYAQDVMRIGGEQVAAEKGHAAAEGEERHMTGQQLCEAARIYASEQYGYMAKSVLNSWGIERTSCLGDIVYNLIEISWMKKSPNDRREDFDDVYDFTEAFETNFEITNAE